jgi:hypothetical protein
METAHTIGAAWVVVQEHKQGVPALTLLLTARIAHQMHARARDRSLQLQPGEQRRHIQAPDSIRSNDVGDACKPGG